MTNIYTKIENSTDNTFSSSYNNTVYYVYDDWFTDYLQRSVTNGCK